MTRKAKLSEKPLALMTEAEKIAKWREDRARKGGLDTPKGKYKWGTRSSSRKESDGK